MPFQRDAPNGWGDPAGRPYEAAMVMTARNGKVAIHSWNGTSATHHKQKRLPLPNPFGSLALGVNQLIVQSS